MNTSHDHTGKFAPAAGPADGDPSKEHPLLRRVPGHRDGGAAGYVSRSTVVARHAGKNAPGVGGGGFSGGSGGGGGGNSNGMNKRNLGKQRLAQVSALGATNTKINGQ